MNRRASGVLFIAAGVFFFIAAFLAEQRAFYGVGFPFIGLGVAVLIGVSKNPRQKC